MKLYKLTKQDGTTHNGFPYAVNGNEEHSLPEVANPRTCSEDVLHAYKSVELAFLLNPIHANIEDPRLWEIEGDVVVDKWDKVGSFKQKIVKELPVPSWVKDNKVKVRFARLCADAAARAADAAARAADAAARAADAAARAAYEAADAAARAAYEAARAAAAARAARAAYEAVRAAADARADAHAAYEAADAARAAACAADAARAARAAYAAYEAAGIITTDIQKIAELAINQHQTK